MAVVREAERNAFAKACGYLNYNAAAKWSAHVAGALTAVVYVALLVVLWLFTDLMVHKGRLPNFYHLSQAEQARFWRDGVEGVPYFVRLRSEPQFRSLESRYRRSPP